MERATSLTGLLGYYIFKELNFPQGINYHLEAGRGGGEHLLRVSGCRALWYKKKKTLTICDNLQQPAAAR